MTPPPDSAARAGKGVLYLTLDVEPDYGRAGTYAVLDRSAPFFDWLREARMPLTAFVVGDLLERGHPVVDRLQEDNIPIAPHGFRHAPGAFGTMRDSHAEEIERAAQAYARRVGRPPRGYRAPAGIVSREDILLLDRLGFRYDASVFPLRRPGRFDFRGLPRTPFRWEGTQLVEAPFGLMTRSLPAGMTFINLLGTALSVRLVARAATAESAGYVLDLHLHNLVGHLPALRAVPPAMRLMYRVGGRGNGLARLQVLTERLRLAGFAFGDLEADLLRLKPDDLPVCGFDGFDRAT